MADFDVRVIDDVVDRLRNIDHREWRRLLDDAEEDNPWMKSNPQLRDRIMRAANFRSQ